MTRSLSNFADDTTAVLSCHVQIFVVIWLPIIELQHSEVSIVYELWAEKKVSETGPRSISPYRVQVMAHLFHVTRPLADGSVQNYSISIDNEPEIPQSRTEPLI